MSTLCTSNQTCTTTTLLGRLATKQSGGITLDIDFNRFMPKSNIFTLTQNGETFITKLVPQHSAIGNLYKANICTMNNFLTISNTMIFPRKYSKSQNLGRKNLSLRAYSENLHSKPKDLLAKRSSYLPQKLAQNNKYHFILTPFINHNYFFELGRYNLHEFDYGFLTAFSGKITPSNTLGANFMMSDGRLIDLYDKDFHISNLNINLGLHYKLDLIWDMYLKARSDVFCFLKIKLRHLRCCEAIKVINCGFGASVGYGKDFDFKQSGVLGIEAGLDYKVLYVSTITLDSVSYLNSLYCLLYMDLGLNYAKYFNFKHGSLGLNAGLGIKGNVTSNKFAKSKIILTNLNRIVDMVLDNDKVLGYTNVTLNYILNHKNFDMEFSLAYYGNFGDRIMSNGGGVEWCTTW